MIFSCSVRNNVNNVTQRYTAPFWKLKLVFNMMNACAKEIYTAYYVVAIMNYSVIVMLLTWCNKCFISLRGLFALRSNSKRNKSTGCCKCGDH